jgi:hypothetical protein
MFNTVGIAVSEGQQSLEDSNSRLGWKDVWSMALLLWGEIYAKKDQGHGMSGWTLSVTNTPLK